MVIDPGLLANDQDILGLESEQLGVFWTLLPFCSEIVLPETVSIRARFAGLTLDEFDRVWPRLEQFFDHVPGGWRLRPLRWLTIDPGTPARTSLRHLFDQLIDIWGDACVYCGNNQADLHIEHIIPRARGGPDDITNLTLACGGCNSKKGTQTAAEFGFSHIQEQAARIQ